MSDLAGTFERFTDAINAPRKWRDEPCCICGRPAGSSCDIDRHAELETQAVT